MGKPICRREKDGLVSVNWNWRSKVVLTESVLLDFVGLMNLREVGEVVSIVIL